MALKTVLKLLLSKFAPLSVEMQTATIVDQSVVVDAETLNISYADNMDDDIDFDEVRDRIEVLILKAESTSELLEIKKSLPDEYKEDADLLNTLEHRKQTILNKQIP
jgi:recombination protein RecT